MIERLAEYTVLIYTPCDDFREIRDALVDLTWEAGHCARPARCPSELSSIEKAVAAADVLVIVSPSMTQETRAACTFAVRNEKPILAYLVGADCPRARTELGHIVSRAPEGSSVKHVHEIDRDNLGSEYLFRLNQLVRTLDKRARRPETEGDVYIPNPFVRKFVNLAQQWQVLNARCDQDADLKRSIAGFVLDLYFPRLLGAGVRQWFLESGSSIAYLAEALTANWARLLAKVEIETNNILTYLELVSADSVRFSLYPPGRPEDKYGATFGPLRSVSPPVKPNSMGHPIEADARFEMEKIKEHLVKVYGHGGLIFSATSGIELRAGNPFRGLHVGSYSNMLFKRAILEAGRESDVAVMILADEDKVPYEFNPDKCFPICDMEFSWDTVCQEVPLAIACSFRSEQTGLAVARDLKALGFRHEEFERRGQVPWCMIVSNDRFWAIRNKWIHASNADEFNEDGVEGIEQSLTTLDAGTAGWPDDPHQPLGRDN